jgi:hypothetical protein
MLPNVLRYLLGATIVTFLVACERVDTKGEAMSQTRREITEAEWKAVAQKKVFFGHQSVGWNILEGVGDLATTSAAKQVKIAAVTGKGDYSQPVFGHAEVGHNTNPKSKIDDFAKYLDSGIGNEADVAVLKFCYVDVEDDTNMAKVFDEYKATVDQLKDKYPRTTFVHVTMPLVAKQDDIKTWAKNIVKKVIGRPVRNVSLNAKRGEYNERLIREYGGRDAVFDLAKIESTAPGGARVEDSVSGQKFYLLAKEYTYDGGHLNELGRRVVAAELIKFLASLPERPGSK